jgi:hypothetical protein
MSATDYTGKRVDGGSLGAHRVRESFNPSEDNVVDQIKRATADLIDLVDTLRHDVSDVEQARIVSLAQTHYENAAMWAVKAATTPK